MGSGLVPLVLFVYSHRYILLKNPSGGIANMLLPDEIIVNNPVLKVGDRRNQEDY